MRVWLLGAVALIITVSASGCSSDISADKVISVDYFTAEPESISCGGSTTLTWSVYGTHTVSIDQGVGNVALAGSVVVSPTQTTRYVITATNDSGIIEDIAEVVVTVAPPKVYTATVSPVISESGYVSDDGSVFTGYVRAGDNRDNLSLQAFVSFDISEIPAGATITECVVDFSDYAMIEGDPFRNLACLRVYLDDYGTLDAGDYIISPDWSEKCVIIGGRVFYNFPRPPGDVIILSCSTINLKKEANPYIISVLQERLGSSRLQARLQFSDTETDDEGDDDFIAWTSENPPRLIITYCAP